MNRGWILTVAALVTLAAVAVAYQVVAPHISAAFEIIAPVRHRSSGDA